MFQYLKTIEIVKINFHILYYRYVDIVAGMTVTEDGQIVIVDSVQPSLYKLDEHGSLSTWFDCKGVMTEPSDIAVRGKLLAIINTIL